MKRPTTSRLGIFCSLLLAATARAQPSPAATTAFDTYITQFENGFEARHPLGMQPLGAPLLEHLPTPSSLPGAMLQHWRATTFAPGAHAADLERLLRAFDTWPQRFAPQVLAAHAEPLAPDHLIASMRVRQKRVLTVVLDADYDVRFGPPSPAGGWSASRSTHIYELDANLSPLPDTRAHGFLWRLNTYWSYQERPGGLLLQVDTISLSRAIPAGLGWALRPYVESVPRDSLEFTLHSAINAITSH